MLYPVITLLFLPKKIFFLSIHQENDLHIAARKGDLDAVRHLIHQGTDVNIKKDKGVSAKPFSFLVQNLATSFQILQLQLALMSIRIPITENL